jgi:hypothetical protein
MSFNPLASTLESNAFPGRPRARYRPSPQVCLPLHRITHLEARSCSIRRIAARANEINTRIPLQEPDETFAMLQDPAEITHNHMYRRTEIEIQAPDATRSAVEQFIASLQ